MAFIPSLFLKVITGKVHETFLDFFGGDPTFFAIVGTIFCILSGTYTDHLIQLLC